MILAGHFSAGASLSSALDPLTHVTAHVSPAYVYR